MDLLPFATITADRAVRHHFRGGRVGPEPAARRVAAPGPTASGASAAPTPATYRGAAAVRARVAGLLYRGARAVEPCGYGRPATH